jgi:hypothetical protein
MSSSSKYDDSAEIAEVTYGQMREFFHHWYSEENNAEEWDPHTTAEQKAIICANYFFDYLGERT